MIKNKKIAILGFGKEGKSTFKLILKINLFELLHIYDENKIDTEIKNQKIFFYSNTNFLNIDYNLYDAIFKSPGIASFKLPQKLLNNEALTSQTKIFISKYKNQIIGITGTKGKSTTASLLYNILKTNGKKVLIAGNIGTPFFELIPKIQKETIIIAEFSSHQLEQINQSPHIAVLLNLFEEHLDNYNSKQEYFLAKTNIFKYQNSTDFCYLNLKDNQIKNQLKNICLNSKLEDISNLEEIDFNKINSNLTSYIHLFNISVAFKISKYLKILEEKIYDGINKFKLLEHRLEYVGKVNNIYFYNDSISTIPESTIFAMRALKKVTTIILGGFDRKICYKILYNYLNKNKYPKNIILFGEAGKRMQKEFCENKKYSKKIFYSKNFYEIIEICKKITNKGEICLLSPAAPSYGDFKNFEQRGEVFKKSVLNI